MATVVQKYDFYAKPPKTREEIRTYLVTWLEPISSSQVFEVEGENFVLEKAFRRAAYSHEVFRSLKTNKYYWYVFPDNISDFTGFPTSSYDSFNELIDSVVEQYYALWNI